MTPDAKEAKRKRGRAWNSRVERCDTCKFLTDRKSEFVGWRLCEKHNKEFTVEGDPETLHRVRVGDVIQMRVVVNT
jgi:hypothetical protein